MEAVATVPTTTMMTLFTGMGGTHEQSKSTQEKGCCCQDCLRWSTCEGRKGGKELGSHGRSVFEKWWVIMSYILVFAKWGCWVLENGGGFGRVLTWLWFW